MSNVQLCYTQVIDPISFKSIPSGKIYIGEYGTLPNPANAGTWKQAYFVNSDGTRTAASQPIATNAAGYAVDGSGNIKSVQVDGQYSVLVQSSFGVTKFSNPKPTNAVSSHDVDLGNQRTQADKNAEMVSVADFGATTSIIANNAQAFIEAAIAAGEGGTIFVPVGDWRLVGPVNILPVNIVGAGQGATNIIFDNTGSALDGFVYSSPTNQNIQFGVCRATIKTIGGNGKYAITTPSGAGINSKRPKPTFEHLSFCSTDTASLTDSFAQDYSWEFMFLLGDAWDLTLRAIDACGSYLPENNPATQTLDGFIRANPAEGILSMRASNITTHNVANFFELVQKTYFSFSDIDVARAYRGVYDAADRMFETNVYAYGESVWNNVIINAQLYGVKLKNRFDLSVFGLIVHRAGSAFDHGSDWIGIDLERARVTQLSGVEVSSTAGYTGNQIGVRFDGGDANSIEGIVFGTLDVGAQIGVTGSANGASQSVSISNFGIFADITKVLDIQNARSFRGYGFKKSSAYSYVTFVSFGDSTTQSSCEFLNCPTGFTLSGEGNAYIKNPAAGADQKIWLIDHSSGLTLQTRTDANAAGENAIVITRTGTTVTKAELRSNASSGFVLLSGNNVQVSNVLKPTTDNNITLGNASFRWSTVYAGTGTINTSDGREKTAPLPIDDAVLDAWGDVQLITFQWIDAVRQKGEDTARWHFGVIAQQVRDAFAARGLDGTRYGLLCYDQWGDQYEPVMAVRENQETGEQEEYDTGEKRLALAAGDRWGIRADQCLFLEAAYQRRRSDRIEQRLIALENK